MTFVRDILFWLDATPVRYWTMAWICYGILLLLAITPNTSKRIWVRHAGCFCLVLVVTLFAFRWPVFFFRADLNPDEAQILAGAITLNHDPVVWRSLDTTTHGPLLEYLLLIAHGLGAPFNYATARVVGTLLQAVALIAVWGTLRRFVPETLARLGVLSGLTFWSLIAWEDFLHYSSELPGIALLTIATWTLAITLTPPLKEKPRTSTAFLTGLAAGLVPLAKLQSAPHAAGLLLVAAGFIWFSPSLRVVRGKLLLWLCAGTASVGLGLALFLQWFSLWREFWVTYIASAIDFLGTSAFPFAAMPGRFFNFSATAPVFALFFWSNVLFAVLYLREPSTDQRLRLAQRVGWVLFGLAIFTVLRPGLESAHYLHLLVAPLTLLVGLTLGGVMSQLRPWRVILVFFTLALLPQIWERMATGSRFIGNAATHWHEPPSETAQYILSKAQPGDTMAMWGWQPHLQVEVQMPHATREAQSGNQIMQWPLTSFFVGRYVHDMIAHRPAWFVDVVGPGAFIFDSRATQAHESVPALRDLITQNYELETEIGSIRVYHLKPSPSSG